MNYPAYRVNLRDLDQPKKRLKGHMKMGILKRYLGTSPSSNHS